jgi:hypothetical protein
MFYPEATELKYILSRDGIVFYTENLKVSFVMYRKTVNN